MNIDAAEVQKFEEMADHWWDKTGPCRPLHDLNPARVDFIVQSVDITDTAILDIGCGAGILSEALAQLGASVTGIDAGEGVIKVAQEHSQNNGLTISYHQETAEIYQKRTQQQFPIIACMELLEHVPEPWALIETASKLLEPGGSLFISTLNRTPQAFLKTIVGAEYLLRLLPRGTHHYREFIRPSELTRWARKAGLTLKTLRGLHYHPFTHTARLVEDIGVNYLAHFTKPGG